MKKAFCLISFPFYLFIPKKALIFAKPITIIHHS